MSEWATWDVSPWALQKTVVKKWNFFFPFIFISWRLITLQYCSETLVTYTAVVQCFSKCDCADTEPQCPRVCGSSYNTQFICTSPFLNFELLKGYTVLFISDFWPCLNNCVITLTCPWNATLAFPNTKILLQ